jgi:hypothetical protein
MTVISGQPPDDPTETETLPDVNDYNDIPLDDLTQLARARSPASHFGVAF